MKGYVIPSDRLMLALYRKERARWKRAGEREAAQRAEDAAVDRRKHDDRSVAGVVQGKGRP